MENRNGTSMYHGLSRSVHEVWWSSDVELISRNTDTI